MVLRGNDFEINLGWFSNQISTQIISKWKKNYLYSVGGAMYMLKSTHYSWYYYFVNVWEAFWEFEAVVPPLCAFHMDLHSPTHVLPNFQY